LAAARVTAAFFTVATNKTLAGAGGCGEAGKVAGTIGSPGTGVVGGPFNQGFSLTTISSIYALDSASTSAPDVSGSVTSDTGNIIGNPSGRQGFFWGGDRQNGNPLVGPLQYNGGPTETMALLAGSPAIDHGAAWGEASTLSPCRPPISADPVSTATTAKSASTSAPMNIGDEAAGAASLPYDFRPVCRPVQG
jgi:hypothetical protein